ncbi:MAG: hypothetical protein H0W25_06515, partial [Acidimicrobiia bacterium]|nr:hypothetical protein [Acidimicrobiia bacterium]
MPDPDRLAPERLRAGQRRGLARYLADEVHPFSTTEAARLDSCGLGARGVRELGDLGRLPPVALETVDGIQSVLRPTAAGLEATPLRWRWRWARATGRQGRFVDDRIEPAYRAIHFDDHEGVVVASSAVDLDRLADLGRRALERAGVRDDDAVVSVLPARGDLAFWQLTLGCRRGGVPALHLGERVAAGEVAAYA